MGMSGLTSESVGAPFLVALDTKTGLMRRYARSAAGRGKLAVEVDIAQFNEWELVRSKQQGHAMESIHQFRKYGSKVFV